MFLDYLKGIYPSQLTVEKAKKSDHLAHSSEIMAVSFQPGDMTNM